ncbi:MAG: hypothetical protein K0R26_1722 [Bacteroidota bacterium]|jgi:galactose mutarotase-like enzyme|nr:hypothetical protein [Bacteroidota bacterium]
MKIYQLKNEEFTVKVKSFGAELCSAISEKTHIEYIWQADPGIWPRHAPNLFPIVGKLKGGQFTYEYAFYKLPQHGFARDNEFVCIEETPDSLTFELTANENLLEVFPFHFSFQVTYRLKGNRIDVIYSVFNPDNKDLMFSVGAHPAFNCPLQPNESFEDYELVFPHKDSLTVHTLNDGLITRHTKELQLANNRLKISTQLFDNDALVCMDKQIEEVKLVSTLSKHGVSVISKDWPFYGIWTKKGARRFVCLEPWYGIADSEDMMDTLEKKIGIIKLSPGQTFECSFEIALF